MLSRGEKTDKLCASDYKFMTLVWEQEPIPSTQLVKISLQELGWKKSTTYTMLKKLSEKGYLQNENSIVTSLIPKEKVQAVESEYVVNHAFAGSLPAFVAAFVSNHSLTKAECGEIRQLLQNTEES